MAVLFPANYNELTNFVILFNNNLIMIYKGIDCFRVTYIFIK